MVRGTQLLHQPAEWVPKCVPLLILVHFDVNSKIKGTSMSDLYFFNPSETDLIYKEG